MRKEDSITTQQTAMLIALAYHEQGRGLGELLPLQVTRDFFKHALTIVRWQTFHSDNLNQLVLWGWLAEHGATHGTIFYSLTSAGRRAAYDHIDRADKCAFHFIPQSRSLFDLSGEV